MTVRGTGRTGRRRGERKPPVAAVGAEVDEDSHAVLPLDPQEVALTFTRRALLFAHRDFPRPSIEHRSTAIVPPQFGIEQYWEIFLLGLNVLPVQAATGGRLRPTPVICSNACAI
jgi:hypothetical protein